MLHVRKSSCAKPYGLSTVDTVPRKNTHWIYDLAYQSQIVI